MSSHTTVSFRDLQKADNWSANFWVNMQKEFDTIKNKNHTEVTSYCVDLIKSKGPFIGIAIKKIQAAESTERCVASAVYARIEKALALCTHLYSKESPTIGTLSSILKQKIKRTHENIDAPVEYESKYLQEILKIRLVMENLPTGAGPILADDLIGNALNGEGNGYLYQAATILAFVNSNFPDDVLKESYSKLLEALEHYNNIAAVTSGEVIILPHAPLFKESNESLDDDIASQAKPN